MIAAAKPSWQHFPKFEKEVLRKDVDSVKLTTKTWKHRQRFLMFSCQWGCFDVFVNFGQLSHFVLEFILLTLNRLIPAEYILTCAFVKMYFVIIFNLLKISIFYFNLIRKVHSCLTNLHLKAVSLFKYVCSFVTTRHYRVKCKRN